MYTLYTIQLSFVFFGMSYEFVHQERFFGVSQRVVGIVLEVFGFGRRIFWDSGASKGSTEKFRS